MPAPAYIQYQYIHLPLKWTNYFMPIDEPEEQSKNSVQIVEYDAVTVLVK